MKMTPICNICGNESTFILRENEREGWLCSNCSASSRHRAVVYVLGKCTETGPLPLAAWHGSKLIHILESSGRGSYPMMLKEKFTYYNTEYRANAAGAQESSRRYADFQHLAYQDGQFDYVIATDVFEHIRDDEKALREVFRVLKTDGVFIMTVPYHHDWEKTLIRVKPEGDKDIFLLPPEYHGGGGQTLAYRTYGRDLLERLKDQGYSVGCLELEVPAYAIGRQFVFIGVKSNYIDLSKFHPEITEQETQSPVRASPLLLFRLFVILKYNTLSLRHFASEVIRKVKEKFGK